MDLGLIYAKAWNLTWKHKLLWIFGILASIYSMGNFVSIRAQAIVTAGTNPGFAMKRYFETLNPLGWVLIGLGTLALTVLISYVIVSAQAALAHALWQSRHSPTVEQRLGVIWRAGQDFFWRVLLYNLYIGALSLAAGLLAGGLWLAATSLCGALFFLPCILAGALGILTGLIQPLGILAIVGENRGVVPALKRAWTLLRAQAGGLLYLWLITSFISLAILAIALTPILLGVSAGFARGGQTDLFVVLLTLAGFALMLILGVLTVFLQAVWLGGFEKAAGWLTELAQMKTDAVKRQSKSQAGRQR